MIAKAAAMPAGFRASMVQEHARRLLEDHPIAPRRGAAVAKAKAAEKDPPVPVFDADGNLIGVCEVGDIMPVAGKQPTAQAPAATAPAADGQPVAKGRQVSVWDQRGQRYVTAPGNVRVGLRKAAAEDFVTVYDSAGRPYKVPRAALRTPEEQARDTGPVNVGGTTGLGQPRKTGPAAALPADGPQQALPGAVPGRQVIKAAPTGPRGVTTLGDVARERRLARIAKATGQDLTRPHM